MTVTIFISTPLGKTLSLNCCNLSEVKIHITQELGIPSELLKFHCGGRQIVDSSILVDLQNITLFLACEGGKGGFGSLLRNQAQTRRKITNWDHSRDLDGRRIGNVKNENSLVDFFKKRREEETKIQAEVEQVKIMQNTIKQNEVDIRLDNSYRKKLEKNDKMIEQSMLLGMQNKKNEKQVQKKEKVCSSILAQLDEAILAQDK